MDAGRRQHFSVSSSCACGCVHTAALAHLGDIYSDEPGLFCSKPRILSEKSHSEPGVPKSETRSAIDLPLTLKDWTHLCLLLLLRLLFLCVGEVNRTLEDVLVVLSDSTLSVVF